MRTAWGFIQAVLSAFCGWLGWALGGYDGFLYTLIAFMVIDYATGVAVGVLEKKLSSVVGFRGICKKVLILVMVGIAHAIDRHIIGNGETVRMAILAFYISNEGVSLLENAARIGLPIPEKLKDILTQLHGKGNGNHDN
jgi:toxin secretion/phage lysis holin